MTTVRQIERHWTLGQYRRLVDDLLANRPEAAAGGEIEDVRLCAAALAMIRLDELGQSHVPFYRRILQTVLAAQQRDGGWGDLITTSLCLRALLADDGRGAAIEGGMAFLANLQQPGGIWPKVPLRRMPGDALVSAFVVYQLGDRAIFQSSVRLDEAIVWFEAHAGELDLPVQHFWRRAAARCRLATNPSRAYRDMKPMANCQMQKN